jgi:hypothetical protein
MLLLLYNCDGPGAQAEKNRPQLACGLVLRAAENFPGCVAGV